MTGLQILTVSALTCLAAALIWVAIEYLLGQENRHQEWRADIDQAIALTKERHPSTPPEDRPDWPPA